MANSKTVRRTQAALKPAVVAETEQAPAIQRQFDVTGVHVCVPEPLTAEQVRDACEEQIRELAYQKWEASGCPSCDGFDFWLEAEQEILAERMAALPVPSETLA